MVDPLQALPINNNINTNTQQLQQQANVSHLFSLPLYASSLPNKVSRHSSLTAVHISFFVDQNNS